MGYLWLDNVLNLSSEELREDKGAEQPRGADDIEKGAQDWVFDFEMNAGIFVNDFFLFERQVVLHGLKLLWTEGSHK